MAKGTGKVLAQNKKASHDYFIEETVEGGKEGREASVHFLEEELTRLTKQLREMHPEVK